MPAGFAGSQVRPQSLVFRIHSWSRPLHQVRKLVSVSRNLAKRRMISPRSFLIKMGSWQQ